LAEEVGSEVAEFIDWVREGMLAYAKYAYIPEKNMLRPLIANGADLSDYVLPRTGYFGKVGDIYRQFPAGSDFLYSYARSYRMTSDKDLWKVIRNIAQGNGLGDLGSLPGHKVEVNMRTDNADYNAIFALLELYKTLPCQDYLDLARVVGDNIIRQKFHHGFFLASPECLYANFSAIEPLALLALEAAIRGTPEKVPGYLAAGYFAGDYEFSDGTVRGIYADQLFKIKG
jgi:pectate lyase